MCDPDAVGKDLNAILNRGLRVQRSFDMDNAHTRPGRDGDDGKIRLFVRTDVAVIRIIQSDAITAEIDSQPRVGVNRIANDRI